MRLIVLASAFVTALAISATAHATPVTTYFSVNAHDGPLLSFSLNPSKINESVSGAVVQYAPLTFDNGFAGYVNFYEPAWFLSTNSSLGDFMLVVDDERIAFTFVGPQLYRGDESNPIFIPGTYDLDGDTRAGTGVSAHLIISTSPPVPEPSSLVLLGTAVLGCVGALRRRFVKA